MGIVLKWWDRFNSEGILLYLCSRWLFHDDTPHHKHSNGVLIGIVLKWWDRFNNETRCSLHVFVSCLGMTGVIIKIRFSNSLTFCDFQIFKLSNFQIKLAHWHIEISAH
jgi:hypothetical protein